MIFLLFGRGVYSKGDVHSRGRLFEAGRLFEEIR